MATSVAVMFSTVASAMPHLISGYELGNFVGLTLMTDPPCPTRSPVMSVATLWAPPC